MGQDSVSDLYEEHYVDKGFERLDLFVALAERFSVERALYPGSFVHVTPSFVYPSVTYIDTDRRAARFFADPALREFIARHKPYDGQPDVTFHEADYREGIPARNEGFDLLISQYAGFVSRYCKRYLKVGGVFLVNDSHGDASLAFIDDDYVLIATVARRGGKHRPSERNLGAFFRPKRGIEVTQEYLEKTGRGVGYTKTAADYVFRRQR